MVAVRFFLMMELCKMHSFYKCPWPHKPAFSEKCPASFFRYSLDAFVMVVTCAITLVTLRKVKEMLSELLHRVVVCSHLLHG